MSPVSSRTLMAISTQNLAIGQSITTVGFDRYDMVSFPTASFSVFTSVGPNQHLVAAFTMATSCAGTFTSTVRTFPRKFHNFFSELTCPRSIVPRGILVLSTQYLKKAKPATPSDDAAGFISVSPEQIPCIHFFFHVAQHIGIKPVGYDYIALGFEFCQVVHNLGPEEFAAVF